MTNQILMAIAVLCLFVSTKIPALIRSFGKLLREFRFTDNSYVEVER